MKNYEITVKNTGDNECDFTILGLHDGYKPNYGNPEQIQVSTGNPYITYVQLLNDFAPGKTIKHVYCDKTKRLSFLNKDPHGRFSGHSVEARSYPDIDNRFQGWTVNCLTNLTGRLDPGEQITIQLEPEESVVSTSQRVACGPSFPFIFVLNNLTKEKTVASLNYPIDKSPASYTVTNARSTDALQMPYEEFLLWVRFFPVKIGLLQIEFNKYVDGFDTLRDDDVVFSVEHNCNINDPQAAQIIEFVKSDFAPLKPVASKQAEVKIADVGWDVKFNLEPEETMIIKMFPSEIISVGAGDANFSSR